MNSNVKKTSSKKKILFVATIMATIMLISFGCDKKSEPDVNCLGVFITIGLALEHPNGLPVLLDSSKVFWVSQNRYLEESLHWWYSARRWGNYTIVNDNMQRELYGRSEIMRFTGYLNGEIVHEQNVLVGANRCHVEHLGTEPLTHVLYDIPDSVWKNRFCELINVEHINDFGLRTNLVLRINMFVARIDRDLPYEDKLQKIVDWFLSIHCITDAWIDCVLCVPTTSVLGGNDSRIGFSFVEDGQTVNVIMLVSGVNNRPSFVGFIFE